MEPISPEIGNQQPSSENKQSLLNSWIERGFNEDAMFVFGTSTNLLKNALSTSMFPSYPKENATLPYQRKMLREYKHLYYALPIVENLKVENINLARKIGRRHQGYGTLDNLPKNLQTDFIREIAKWYAFPQAFEEAFRSSTGIKASSHDLSILMHKLDPELFKSNNMDKYFHWADEGPELDDKLLQESLRLMYSDKDLLEKLNQSAQSKGIVVYYNKNVFGGHKIVNCPESDSEVTILGNEPLTLNDVSGIEVLSDIDKRTLRVA